MRHRYHRRDESTWLFEVLMGFTLAAVLAGTIDRAVSSSMRVVVPALILVVGFAMFALLIFTRRRHRPR